MLRENLRTAFGTDNGRIRQAGTSMQYSPVSDATLRRWARMGLIAKRGAAWVITEAGRTAAE
jgi:hypothetical protein